MMGHLVVMERYGCRKTPAPMLVNLCKLGPNAGQSCPRRSVWNGGMYCPDGLGFRGRPCALCRLPFSMGKPAAEQAAWWGWLIALMDS